MTPYASTLLFHMTPHLEQARELGVAVGHMRQVVYERRDDAAEREQGLVDVASLACTRVCRVRREREGKCRVRGCGTSPAPPHPWRRSGRRTRSLRRGELMMGGW